MQRRLNRSGPRSTFEPAPAERAEHDDAPVRRERDDVLVPMRRADEVDHDVRAVPTRHALDLFGEVLRLVVHARRRALREPGRDKVELVLAQRSRGDGLPACRQSLRQWVGVGDTYAPKSQASWIAAIPTPDAATPPSAHQAQRAPGNAACMRQTTQAATRTGEPDFGDAHGVDEREGCGLRDKVRRGRHHVLGVRALWAEQSVSNVERR
jgi:hypothetical protein